MTSGCHLAVAPLWTVRVTVTNDGPIPTGWNSVYVSPFASALNPMTLSSRPSLTEDRPDDTSVGSAVPNRQPSRAHQLGRTRQVLQPRYA